MTHTGPGADAKALEKIGIKNSANVYWNLPVSALYEESIRRREGQVVDGGPLAVLTAGRGAAHPLEQGFRHAVGVGMSSGPYGYFPPYGIDELAPRSPDEYLTDRLTDETITFIERHPRERFFVLLAHYAIHTPHQARTEHVARFENRAGAGMSQRSTTAAMLYSLDEGLGRILDTLDRLDLGRNTLVVFTSDNGAVPTGTRRRANAPLRGAKGEVYEGGLRVPLVVRWPGPPCRAG